MRDFVRPAERPPKSAHLHVNHDGQHAIYRNLACWAVVQHAGSAPLAQLHALRTAAGAECLNCPAERYRQKRFNGWHD